MTAIRFDPWAELAAIENAECGGAPAKVANPAKVAPAADVPAEWIVGVDRLETMPSPAVVHPDRWRKVVVDAYRFLDQWGGQAAALGWTTLDLFGVHPTHPIARVDHAGLILLLHGDELLAMTAQTARIGAQAGAVMTYQRRTDRGGAVPLWMLA
jgi:hypothetical protein